MGEKLDELLKRLEGHTGWLHEQGAEVRAELAEEWAGKRVVEVEIPEGKRGIQVTWPALQGPAVSAGNEGSGRYYVVVRRLPIPDQKPKVAFWRRPAYKGTEHPLPCMCGRCGRDLPGADGTCAFCGADGEPRDLPD